MSPNAADKPDIESLTEIQRMAVIERLRAEKRYHEGVIAEGVKRALLGEASMPDSITDHKRELAKVQEALFKFGVTDDDEANAPQA